MLLCFQLFAIIVNSRHVNFHCVIIQVAPQYPCLVRIDISFKLLTPSIKMTQLLLDESTCLLSVSFMPAHKNIIRKIECILVL